MATKKVNKATFQFGGEEISLSKSKTQVAVRFNPGMKLKPKRKTAPNEQVRDFEIVTAKSGIDAKLDKLRAHPDVSVGTHVWLVNDEE